MKRTISKRKSHRLGGAAAEAAICLPLILVILSATIELSTAVFLKESLTVAAYEGARVAIQRQADNDAVVARVEEVLLERSISLGGNQVVDVVDVSPDADEADIMEAITVSVTAPVAGNVVTPFSFVSFIGFEELTAEVVMRKEFTLEE